MPENNRPLSPHLGVYRWGLHMALSIFHRATGVALAAGAVLLVWWLYALAAGPDTFAIFREMILTPLGRLVLFGITLSFFFHMFNGVRHLFWDIGRGYAVADVKRSGIFVVLLALVATVGLWAHAYGLWG